MKFKLALFFAALVAAVTASGFNIAQTRDAQQSTPQAGSLEQRLDRIEQAIARLEQRSQGGSAMMQRCMDMMSGGGMMGGGMMGGSRPQDQQRKP